MTAVLHAPRRCSSKSSPQGKPPTRARPPACAVGACAAGVIPRASRLRRGRLLAKAEPTLHAHLAQLKKLHPPKDAQAGWDTYLNETASAIDRFAVLSRRMAGGDRHAATEFDSLTQLSAKGDAWARSYGLKVCGAA